MTGLGLRLRLSVGLQGDNQHLLDMVKILPSTSFGRIKFSELLSLLNTVSKSVN